MLKRPTTYDSAVFKEFNRLDEDNHQSVVHFYEQHKEDMMTLNFDERFIILLAYCNSLYEINAYKKHLRVSDEIVERSIYHNIQFFNGEDIYLKTLYRKAKSFFHLHEYDSAKHIAQELVKITPGNRSYAQLLNKCLIRQRPKLIKRILAMGVFLYLLSVLLVVVNILLVKPISEASVQPMELLRKGIFVAGIGSLLFGIFLHHFMAFLHIKKIKSQAKVRN